METILVDAFVWVIFMGLGLAGLSCSVVGMVWAWRFLEDRDVHTWLAVVAMFPAWLIFIIGGWLIVALFLIVMLVARLANRVNPSQVND